MSDPLGIDPPAIVRPAEDYTEAAILKAMKALRKGMVLDRQAYGIWLARLKAKVGNRRWEETCRKIGLVTRTADRWIERSAQPPPVADDLADLERQDQESILDTLSRIDSGDSDASQLPPTGSAETPVPPLVQQAFLPPVVQPVVNAGLPSLVFCRPCRVGKAKLDCKDCAKLRAEKNPKPPAAGQPVEPVTAPSTPEPGPAAGPAIADVGDAAETLPEGAVLDPDGHALPGAAVAAFGHAEAAMAVVADLRSLAGRLRKLSALPDQAGKYIPVAVVEKLLRSGWRMVDNHILKPGNAYRCDGYEGHGCAGEGCSKCQGFGVVPKPLYGEQSKPKPKKPYYGGRRR